MVSTVFEKIPFLDRLTEEEQFEVREAHPKERVKLLSEFSGKSIDEVMAGVSEVAHLEIDPNPQFDAERVREMPSRFVHAYHCLPIIND